MAERLNATVLKTVIPGNRNREFESHSLHQFLKINMSFFASINIVWGTSNFFVFIVNFKVYLLINYLFEGL